MDGAALVGMHRNMFWRTSDGLELDGGAYIAGLEEATGVRATICGKPAPAYFEAALELLGVPAPRAAMVGDDVANDVLAAQAVGMTGVLVRTGKFREADLQRDDGTPDHVIDSFAELPAILGMGLTRCPTARGTPERSSPGSRPSTSGWAPCSRSGRTRDGVARWSPR